MTLSPWNVPFFFFLFSFFLSWPREAPEGSYLAQNLKEAIDLTSVDHLKEKVEKLFIIGGYAAYEVSWQCFKI